MKSFNNGNARPLKGFLFTFALAAAGLGSIFTIAHADGPVSAAPSAVPQHLETCFSPEGGCDQKLIAFMRTATSTLDVAAYSMTIPELAAAIVEIRDRGVSVRVITDVNQVRGNTSVVRNLVEARIDVRIWDPQRMMHNKFTIVDGRAIETGSFNYSVSASRYNSENQIYIYDENVARAYAGEFARIWAHGSRATPEQVSPAPRDPNAPFPPAPPQVPAPPTTH